MELDPNVITLVIPQSSFLLDQRVFPSLGVLKVASSLEKSGFKVEMLDLSGISNPIDVVEAHASISKSKWWGITATTPQMPAILEVIPAIRNKNTNIKIMIGGPHPTLANAAAKKELSRKISGRATKALDSLKSTFDSVVCGDGENAVLEVIINGLAFVDADNPKGKLWLTDQGFDTSPLPARHLIDMNSYHYTIDGAKSTSIIGQLGCPYSCSFCGGRSSPMLRRIRNRSPGSVISEIKSIHKEYGFTGIMCYDDELNVSKSMVEMMKGITNLGKELNVKWTLRGFIKSELFTDEQAEAMAEAGFKVILTGFESGSPRILENINKKATREDNDRCVEIARRHGLKVKALMSIGHPGESHETVLDTKNWLLKTKPDFFDCTIISTYMGTPYFDEAVETSPGIWTYTAPKSKDRLHSYDVDFSKEANYYKGDPNDGYVSYVFTDYLTAPEIVKLRGEVEAEVRKELNLPYDTGMVAQRYEHSMGQTGPLPSYILKTSKSSN